MYQLLLIKNNKIIQKYKLDTSKKYIIGRSSSCDIHLDSTLGVSRKHAKLTYSEPEWILENISITNSIISQETPVKILPLKINSKFSIKDFDFIFVTQDEGNEALEESIIELESNMDKNSDSTSEAKEKEQNVTPPQEHDAKEEGEDAYHFETPPPINEERPLGEPPSLDDAQSTNEDQLINEEQSADEDNQIQEDEQDLSQKKEAHLDELLSFTSPPDQDFEDKTMIEIKPLKAHITIQQGKKTTKEKSEIHTDSWIVGRDGECNTTIKSNTLSRFHFEITKKQAEYWITDLGSTNGTKLNGKRLKEKYSKKLKSGDTIKIKSIKIKFYLSQLSSNIDGHLPTLPQKKSLETIPIKSSKKNRKTLFIIVGVALISIVISTFLPKKDSEENTQNKQVPKSHKQEQVLSDMLKLAQLHYRQGKYQFCLEEIKKIKSIVVEYKYSKSLESYCKQAVQIEQDKLVKKTQRKKQEELELKIFKITQECKNKFDKKIIDISELQKCLYPATTINPDHPHIINIKAYVQALQLEEQEKKNSQKKYQRLLKTGKRKHNKALSLFNQKKWKQSIKAFDEFINFKFSGTNHLKKEAVKKRETAKKKLSQLIKNMLSKSISAMRKKNYKEAYLNANKILVQYPSNKMALDIKKQSFKLMKKNARLLYQDSIFEESVGNISFAKEKWKKIINISVPKETYYERAKDFLRKYGDY